MPGLARLCSNRVSQTAPVLSSNFSSRQAFTTNNLVAGEHGEGGPHVRGENHLCPGPGQDGGRPLHR
jgi:hypothetical protein